MVTLFYLFDRVDVEVPGDVLALLLRYQLRVHGPQVSHRLIVVVQLEAGRKPYFVKYQE